MAIKQLFKSYLSSNNYITVKGRTCSFVEGRYLTDHPDEIAELRQIVSDKSSPFIYIDENEKEVDTTTQERLQGAAKKAILEELERINAEKAASQEGNKQTGTTQVAQPDAAQGMTPAALLNVTSTAQLGKLSVQSNQK